MRLADCFEIFGSRVELTASLHAFCGGIQKQADGSWINGSPVSDFVGISREIYWYGKPLTSLRCRLQTAEAVAGVKAKITGQPLGQAGCIKFAKKHTQ